MKAEIDKVSQWRFLTHSLAGWLGAILCAVTIHYVSIFIILPVGMLLWGFHQTTHWFGWIIFYILLIFIACPFLFIPGLAVGRFLLRLYPPALSGKWRKVKSIGILILFLYFYAVVWSFFDNALEGLNIMPHIHPLVARVGESFLYFWLAKIYSNLGWLIPLSGLVTPIFLRHWALRKSLKKPYVLFLRRFSSYADRAINNFILKGTPAGRPVAFLTATHSRAGDWNPYLVGFSGIKLQRLIRSIPIIVRSTDEDWEEAAKELIQKSKKIVIDLSEGSGPIETEINMIKQAARWSDTVILIAKEKANGKELEQCEHFAAKGANIVAYTKSWRKATPKLFFGLLVAGLLSIPFFIIPTFPVGISVFFFSEELQQAFMDFIRSVEIWYKVFLFTFGAVGWGWLYYVFFVRPVFNKTAKKALKDGLS